jgi:hypothetical protein
VAHIKHLSVADLKPKKPPWPTFVDATLFIPEFKMIHQNIQKLINDYQEILDRDPLDQMEDTQSILTRFTQLLAAELGEIVVASPYMEGVHMYFDEKIARYEIKKSVGL